MAAPTYTTTIPRSNPDALPAGAPRIPSTADAGRAELMPAVDLLDDQAALNDDEDDGGAFAGAPLVQLAQFQPAAGAAPSSEPRLDERYRIAQVERQQESDLDWLMRMTGGYPQPQQQSTGQGGPTLHDPAPGADDPIAPLPASTQQGAATAPATPANGVPATPQAHLRGILERGAGPPNDPAAFAASENWWGAQSERVWSFVQSLLETRRRMLDTMGGGMSPLAARGGGTGNAVQDWLENKVKGNIGEAQRRQTEAAEIAAGTRAAPQTGLGQEVGRDVARGAVGIAASTIKGAAYGWEWARGGRMSDAAEANIYQVATVIDEWAKQQFPNDPARQHEFTGMLAEGFGSMVTFLGPGLATQILARGGPRAMALIMGGTSGTTGGLAQAGAMTDDAMRAMREGRTVGGEPVNEETLRRIFPWAAGIGASEAAPIMRFLNRSGGTAVTRTLSQMAEEGGQEWFQSVGENIVARANYDDLRRWDDNAWSNLTIGAILGGGMQGGAELRGNVREARLGGSRTDVSPHQQPTPGQPPAGPPPLPGEEGRLPWMQPHIDDAIRQMLGDAAQPPPAQSHSLLQQMLSDTSPAVVRLSLDTLVVGRAVQ